MSISNSIEGSRAFYTLNVYLPSFGSVVCYCSCDQVLSAKRRHMTYIYLSFAKLYDHWLYLIFREPYSFYANIHSD